jgi:hypothetical protein
MMDGFEAASGHGGARRAPLAAEFYRRSIFICPDRLTALETGRDWNWLVWTLVGVEVGVVNGVRSRSVSKKAHASFPFFFRPLRVQPIRRSGGNLDSRRRAVLGGQPDLGDVELLENVQHADHVLVIHLVGALHHHAQARVLRLQLLQVRFQHRDRHQGIV